MVQYSTYCTVRYSTYSQYSYVRWQWLAVADTRWLTLVAYRFFLWFFAVYGWYNGSNLAVARDEGREENKKKGARQERGAAG